MRTLSHPGPWNQSNAGYGQIAIRDARGVLVCLLHSIPRDMPRRDLSVADRAAVAQMIMALPELAQMLRSVTDTLELQRDTPQALVADARALLAKVGAL